MRNKLVILGIFAVFSCKAQQTYPLNTFPDDVPSGSYMKDLANELVFFTGTWVTNFNGKNITLFITKEDYKYFELYTKNYYQDIISIKYTIKNSSGTIIQNTQNMNFQPNQIMHTIYSMGTRPSQNAAILDYGGTNCSVGNGKIILKKLNATQISWEYIPNSTIIDRSKCPVGTDINIYLPETKDLIFTKQ
ncbi:DUF6705 family protein [Chryseobacterium aurantiacum]|uniref:DUF6705 family protein n=1 Tax=Chryseobacterium aurantiacum TaxID=2116499 RepID=UPI000D1164AD|nr:DUF6705 family protein [Chryseobacterium aurantiacum]